MSLNCYNEQCLWSMPQRDRWKIMNICIVGQLKINEYLHKGTDENHEYLHRGTDENQWIFAYRDMKIMNIHVAGQMKIMNICTEGQVKIMNICTDGQMKITNTNLETASHWTELGVFCLITKSGWQTDQTIIFLKYTHHWYPYTAFT